MEIILYLITGFVAGIISGMGIGGGVVLIPVLTLFLGFEQKIAQGVNLMYFIPTGAAALWVHYKNKCVETKIALVLAAFGVLGSATGAYLAAGVSSLVLRKLFALLIIIVGTNELFAAAGAKE